MKIRLTPLLLLAVFLGPCLPGVSTAFASKERPVIGLSLDTLKEERWQKDRDSFIAKVESLGGRVIVQSANGDDSRQTRDIGALITRGVDVLVVVAHNGSALTRAIKEANESKIPVIAYDRLIMNSDIALYLTFDNVKVGELQARYLVDHAPKDHPLRIVRLNGAPTDNNAKLFKQGQDNVLDPLIQAGKVKIIFEDWCADWKPENGKKVTNAALTRFGHDFDALLATTDHLAAGGIQALTEDGLAGKIIVTGQDADLSACQRIMRGTQAMTIYKPLKKLADYAGEVAVHIAKGGAIPQEHTIDNGFKAVPAVFKDIVVVDKDNMAETVVADGFHSAADLK
jgi:D-xylose transport system substrate-binding protein